MYLFKDIYTKYSKSMFPFTFRVKWPHILGFVNIKSSDLKMKIKLINL